MAVRDHALYLTTSCDGDAQLWKWVTQNRLFNIGSSLCLGVRVANGSILSVSPRLSVFRCDREPPLVRWSWSCSKFLNDLSTYLPNPNPPRDDRNISAAQASPPAGNTRWRLYGDEQDLCAKTYRGKTYSALAWVSMRQSYQIHLNEFSQGLISTVPFTALNLFTLFYNIYYFTIYLSFECAVFIVT